jgi:environmental stress-induced protein Ves
LKSLNNLNNPNYHQAIELCQTNLKRVGETVESHESQLESTVSPQLSPTEFTASSMVIRVMRFILASKLFRAIRVILVIRVKNAVARSLTQPYIYLLIHSFYLFVYQFLCCDYCCDRTFYKAVQKYGPITSLILTRSAWPSTAWANGGGVTHELLRLPLPSTSPSATGGFLPAGKAEFALRVSCAQVSSNGPFSIFPDVDRFLTPVEGGSLRLECSGDPSVYPVTKVTLGPLSARSTELFAFPGEQPWHCSLVESEPVLDFNVMVARHLRDFLSLRIVSPSDAATLPENIPASYIFTLNDGVIAESTVAKYDLLRVNPPHMLDTTTIGVLCIVMYWRL